MNGSSKLLPAVDQEPVTLDIEVPNCTRILGTAPAAENVAVSVNGWVLSCANINGKLATRGLVEVFVVVVGILTLIVTYLAHTLGSVAGTAASCKAIES